MENTNEQEQDLALEESTTEETVEESNDESSEESVTLSKAEFNKLKRQSFAYKAVKEQPKKEFINNPKTESETGSIIKTLSVLKDIETDEIAALESEAQSLGVDLIKYIKSESGKTVLNNIRNEKKSKSAEINASSKSPIYKKFTHEDFSKMSSGEMEQILPRS